MEKGHRVIVDHAYRLQVVRLGIGPSAVLQ